MRLLLLAATVLLATPARAADRTWTGAGDGQTWQSAQNWSGGAVPGPTDRALIAGASVRLTAPASAQALVLSAGAALDATGFVLTLGTGPSTIAAGTVLTIGGVAAGTSDALVFDGPVAVEGRLDWTGGQVRTDAYYVPAGGKVLTVAPGGTLRWLGAAERILSAALVNSGTLRWEGGRTLYYQGHSFASTGTIDVVLGSDAELRGVGINSAGPWRLANTGTVRKSGAGTLTVSNVELQTVGGTVDVRAGTLDLQASSRHENATVAVAAGATYLLGGVTLGNGVWHEIAGTVTGAPAGAFAIDTGGWASGLDAAPAGGVLDIGGTGLQIRHTNVGGRSTNGGPSEAAPVNRGLVRFVDAPDNRISGLFRNEGTVRWEAGRVLLPVGGRFESAGLFEIALAADAEWLGGSAPLTVSGTLRTTGPATATLRSRLDVTAGTVDVRAGTLVLDLGSRWEDAAVAVALGATLRLAGNRGFEPHVVAGTLAGTPAGTFVVTSASYAVLLGDPGRPGVLNVGGTGVQVDNGYLGGGFGAFEPYPAPRNAGLLRFVGGAQRFIERPFVNSGAVRWEAGQIFQRASAPVTNRGVWTLAAGAAEWTGLNGATFVNEGTLRAETAARMVVALVNRGGLDVGAGTVAVLSGGAFENAFGGAIWGTGTLDVSGLNPAAVVNTGLVSPGAGASGAGVGVLTWRGPFQPGAQARLVAEVGAGAVGDRLAVVGPAALASLQALVRVVGGYAPQPGAAFDGVTATGGITSSLGSVQTVNPAGNVVFVADGQAAGVVTFRAVAGVPVPAVVVSPAPLVNGGRRTAALFAVGLTTESRAALVCDPCLAGPRQRIAGQTVRTVPGGVEVRFDLTSASVLGDYQLVVSAGADSLRAPVRVVPYVSIPLVVQSGAPGLPVRPAPASGATFLTVYNVTNSGEPGLFFVRATPPSPAVRFAASNLLSGPGLPATSPDFFLPVSARFRSPTVVPFRTGISPSDVRFPGQPPGAGANIPLASSPAVRVSAAGFVAPDQFARALADVALRAAADLGGTLADAVALDAARRVVADLVDGGALGARGEAAGREAAGREAARPPGGLFSGITRGALTPAFMRELGSAGTSIAGLEGQITTLLGGLVPGRPAVCTVQTQNPAPTIDEINRVTGTIGDLNSAQQAQVDAVIGNLQSPRGLAALAGCPDDGDVEPVLPQPVRAAFDPNDKSAPTPFGCEIVGEGAAARCGRTLVPLASRAAPLDYTVQFENVAAATGNAETVTVTDVLDARLDPATFEVLASTADSLLTVAVTGQTVTFTFAGIDLPPNRTPPEGQGAVTFRVSPRPGLTDGAEIRNTASIVFDSNPAILTPEVVHVVRATSDLGVAIAAADAGPVQVPIVYTVRVSNPAGADPAQAVALTVPLPTGTTLVDVTTTAGACSGTQTLACALSTLAGGAEVLVTVRTQPSAVGPAVLTASVASATFDGTWYDNAATRPFTVTANSAGEGGPAALTEVVLDRTWPNPVSERATLRFGLPTAAAVTVVLVDLLGREVLRAAEGPMEAGWHEVQVEARGLAAGVYVAVLRAGDAVRTRRVVVVR